MQHPDRIRWYEAKFAADDQPDYHGGDLTASEQAATGVKLVTMSVEISRELVPLRNAYKVAGQRLRVRVGNGAEEVVQVCACCVVCVCVCVCVWCARCVHAAGTRPF